MNEPLIIRLLDEKLGQHRVSGNDYIYCCPYCAKRVGTKDTKYHLYVNTSLKINSDVGWFNCFKCSVVGPIRFIVGENYKDRLYSITPSDNLKKYLIQIFNSRNAQKAENNVALPLDYLEIIYGSDPHKYISNRGITDDLMHWYKLGVGSMKLSTVDPEHRDRYAGSGRVIFPDYDKDGKIEYWVGRSFVNHRSKYKNCRCDSRDKIYNLGNLQRKGETGNVIITEGPISAIMAGKNAVATYGKNVTKDQIIRLVKEKFSSYIVALDGDTRKEVIIRQTKRFVASHTFYVASALKSYGCDVYVVDFGEDEDPASISDFKSRVENAKRFSFGTIEIFF